METEKIRIATVKKCGFCDGTGSHEVLSCCHCGGTGKLIDIPISISELAKLIQAEIENKIHTA